MNESRDYAKYSISSSQIQFIEPSSYGKILRLEARFTAEELDRFRQLVQSVWRRIMSLDMPDTSDYQLNYQAIVEFENYLIDS